MIAVLVSVLAVLEDFHPADRIPESFGRRVLGVVAIV
jgi:hypothetical protein